MTTEKNNNNNNNPPSTSTTKTRVMAASISVVDNNSTSTTHTRMPNILKATFLPPFTELNQKLAGDVIVACGVTLGVAPFMSVIDKSIVQRAAGTHTIIQSCVESVATMVRNPVGFVKSPVFLMMWGVYAATYTTANCLKTIVEHQERNDKNNSFQNTMPSIGTVGVFALTTSVNSSTTMIKDRFYAKHFGTAKAATKVPIITYGLWGLRDCMVIGSSFILPEYMSTTLQNHTDLDQVTALQISQLTCPIATQLIAGPTQLLGLDLYNRPLADLSYKAAVLERVRFQYYNFTSIVGARIARIAPAYGIGGVCNTYFRDWWRNRVEMERDYQDLRNVDIHSNQC